MASTKVSSFDRLLTGAGGIDFIRRTKLWYAITIALIVLSFVSILVRGFSFNIDFEGGTKLSMPAGDLVAEQVEETFVEATGIEPASTQIVGSGDAQMLEIQSEHLSQEQIDSARAAIYEEHQPLDNSGEPSPDAIGDTTVSESWGSTITQRMFLAMIVFLVAAAIYVAIRLEKEMAFAAMAALLVDAIVIAGIYSLFGLEVSPAAVIGLLTVLTFSIYDTVIVFDKVKENTSGILDSRRSTYAEQANLAVNQTVMRSLSTSVISALPIIALLVVAVWLMGIGTLKDLALIQLIGVIEGVFSSLFLATPLLVSLVKRQKKYREHNKLVEQYRRGGENQDSETNLEDSDTQQPRRSVVSPTGPEDVGPQASTWRPHRS